MAPTSKERTEKVSKPVDADPVNEKRKEEKKGRVTRKNKRESHEPSARLFQAFLSGIAMALHSVIFMESWVILTKRIEQMYSRRNWKKLKKNQNVNQTDWTDFRTEKFEEAET